MGIHNLGRKRRTEKLNIQEYVNLLQGEQDILRDLNKELAMLKGKVTLQKRKCNDLINGLEDYRT